MNIKHFCARRILLAGTAMAMLAHAPALAQDAGAAAADSEGLADIIVTAQRREQKLQDVPIAVSAVTSATLESKGIKETLELAQVVPGLSFTITAGNTQVRMRGVGTNSFGPGVENPVAIYLDGVYIASTASALFSLTNIERVEALKGPQGTLFGRNATGGLVQIVTSEPSQDFKGMVRVGYGNYETGSVDAYVSGAASDTVSADFALHYAAQGDGWGTNINTGKDVNRQDDDLIVRSKIKFEPSDGVKFLLAGDYSYSLGSTGVTLQNRQGDISYIGLYERIFTNRRDADPSNDLPLINRGGFYDNSSTLDPRAEITSWGTSLVASFEVGEAEVKSVTAYRQTRFEDRFDIERVPQDVLGFDGVAKWKQFSEELQVNGKIGNLDYTAGVYYFNSKDRWDPFQLRFGPDLAFLLVAPGVTGATLLYNTALKTESLAGYAQATYEFLPDTHITLGGRYTDETKTVSGTRAFLANFGPVTVPFVPLGTPYLPAGRNPKLKYTNFSYRIALDHKLTPDIMAYLSYNTGFKSGGYNLSEPSNPAYRPEKLKALEAGLKMELFDRKVRLNLSAFHYDYSDIQVNNFIGTSQFVTNGPKAKIDGVEAEFDARIADGLTISGSAAYTDDRFTNYPLADYYSLRPGGCDTSFANNNIVCKGDAKGNKLPGTPTFTASFGFNYETAIGDGMIGLNGNLFHSSGFYGTTDNDGRLFQADHQILNASIYFEPSEDGPRFTLWGKNLLDKKYVRNYYISAQQVTYQAAAPLTWGVTVEQKF